MKHIVSAAFAGLAVGAFLTWIFVTPDDHRIDEPAAEIVRDILDVPKMSVAAAEKHREDRYAALQSIDQIYALPSEFGRAEALYALAGRSDSGGVQNLIFEANRIANTEERSGALNILFFRLAELDPKSALVLTRTEYFRSDKNFERRVWISWGRRDLDEALAAANAETLSSRKNSAAQSLFVAFGYIGNEITDRIEQELGVKPDRNTRGQFIYRLADESPAKAIAFINAMEAGVIQQQMVSWLAFHMARHHPESASSYSVLFDNALYKVSYERIIASNVAAENPAEILDRMLASGRAGLSRSEIFSAMRGVAKGDLDVAMGYYARMRTTEDKNFMADAIANALADKDVDAALAWARDNDSGDMPELEMQVLQHVARRDLARAIAEAGNTPNAQIRSNMLTTIIQVAAQTNPQEAIEYLSLIENSDMRDSVAQQVIFSWVRADSDAAVDWLLAQDRVTAGQYLTGSARSFLRSSVDATISLLPLVDDRYQQKWRYEIARAMTTERTASEAMSFIGQFEGEPGYDNLQTAVIAGIAENDILMARQMADQLPNGDAKDAAYTQLVQTRAASHPREAIVWLGLINDEAARGRAATNVVRQWYGNDPTGAEQWVRNLPPGSVRDDAIGGLINQWRDVGVVQEELIESITDDVKRTQARVRQIYAIMQRDPVRARQVLDGLDLPGHERQRLETALNTRYNLR